MCLFKFYRCIWIFKNKKLQWQYVLACTCIYDCMHAVKWYDIYIYIIQNQKLKKWKRQWKKNSERTRKRLKTWRKHGRRDCQSKKRQIRYQYIIPSFCTNSVLLEDLLAASVVIFYWITKLLLDYRVMLMQNAKSRKRKRLFPIFGICMKILPWLPW